MRIARELGWLVAGVGLLVALVGPPVPPADDTVDPGFAQTLCHLQAAGAQHGRDFQFPYGPQHLLLTRAYDPRLAGTQHRGQLLLAAAGAVLLVRLAQAVPSAVGLSLVGGAVLYSLALTLTQELAVLAGVAAVLRPILRERLSPIDAALGPAYLAAVGLAKFTLVGFGLAGLAVLTASLLARRHWRLAPLPWLAYLLAAVGFGWAGGQHPAYLPAYYTAGFEYAGGYSDGMALFGPRYDLVLYLLAVGLTVAAVWRGGWDGRSRAGLALLAMTAGLGWKMGFVRHDGHALVGFAVLLPLPALAGAVRAGRTRWPLVVAATLVAAVGGGLVIAREPVYRLPAMPAMADEWGRRAAFVFDPSPTHAELDRHAEALRGRFALPAIREKVGDAPIDLFTDSQGVALLNGLNLHPRPSLQSVNAVTPAALRRNADQLTGPSAPPFLLLRWQSFDGRFPYLTDGPALLEAVRHYRPVLEENGYHLLERRPATAFGAGTVVSEQTTRLRTVAELPPAASDELRTIQLDVRYNPAGKLRLAAFRPPLVALLVRLDGGPWQAHRLVPGMAGVEFPLDPLFEDARGLWDGRPGPRVTAVQVYVIGAEAWYLDSAVRLTVRSYPRPAE